MTSTTMLLATLGAALLHGSSGQENPVDPPFDTTRVLFSAAFSDHMVLQRAPQLAAVFGTATPGSNVTVHLAGPNNYTFTSTPTPVENSADITRNGTWKVVLPAQAAGFDYTIQATCSGCFNSTNPPATLVDVGFGDVFLCSGQSNMECPVLTTLDRFEYYNRSATGAYDHVRLFQTGWRALGPRNGSSWILPQICEPSKAHPCPNNTEPENPKGGYAFRSWMLPTGNAHVDDDGGHDHGFPDRFSAVCWYFGASLSDSRAQARGSIASEPVPIGLIASTIGGTTIQEWLPPGATGNATCADNNCGFVEQLPPGGIQPQCTATSDVWSCPSGMCSALWHSMIAPFVNVTLAGIVWYQGEQNQIYNGGSATSGYMCLQNALIASWRAAFSAWPGTTAPDVPFGVTSLAGGGAEGFPLWSPDLHTNESVWLDCYTHRGRTPACADIQDDSMGLMRRAQTAGAGFFPASSKVFLGQAHDLGEPCMCDRNAPAPGGCWATDQCFGNGSYSLNITHNYQNSEIHPRPKVEIGQRLARGFAALQTGGAPVPKLSGCRLGADGSLTLSFDASLLRGDVVSLQSPLPGLVPLEVRTGPPTPNSTGWVYALGLRVLNSTSIVAQLPPQQGGAPPDAVRYAWANIPCCPGQRPGAAGSTYFCPNSGCPIITAATLEPAVPFWADIVAGKCVCEAPWVCDS